MFYYSIIVCICLQNAEHLFFFKTQRKKCCISLLPHKFSAHRGTPLPPLCIELSPGNKRGAAALHWIGEYFRISYSPVQAKPLPLRLFPGVAFHNITTLQYLPPALSNPQSQCRSSLHNPKAPHESPPLRAKNSALSPAEGHRAPPSPSYL